MLSWLWGSSERAFLILRPANEAARAIAGFQTGADLRVVADGHRETVGDMLEKLNVYRGPDQQLLHIYDAKGVLVNADTIVKGEMVVFVRADSTMMM